MNLSSDSSICSHAGTSTYQALDAASENLLQASNGLILRGVTSAAVSLSVFFCIVKSNLYARKSCAPPVLSSRSRIVSEV